MFGFLAVYGPLAESIDKSTISGFWPSESASAFIHPYPQVAASVFTPKGFDPASFVATSRNSNTILALNGYVIVDKPISGRNAHLREAAEIFETAGCDNGIKGLVGGSLALIAIDTAGRKCNIFVDAAGSLPIYYIRVGDSWVVSTNPVALQKSGLINLTIDETAFAERALFSYALGNRYPISQIRMLRIGTYLSLNGTAGQIKHHTNIWDWAPYESSPPVEEIAEKFSLSCRRIRQLDDNPAQLQSAGMDSRLITASWPDQGRPQCFTYGNPNAHEITIAKQVAAAKGSSWTHTWQHGDDVADKLDTMFDDTGMIIWPDRFFAAQKMAEDGFKGTLDGLAGDALIGGSIFQINYHMEKQGKLMAMACRFHDYDYRKYSMDNIAERIYQNLLQVNDFNAFRDYLNTDTIDMIAKAKPDILEDIRRDIDYSKPPIPSLALLWRNFLYANRGPYMTIHQGLMCNKFVMVYYPFTNDYQFHEMAFRLPPKDTAYRRLYIKLYRKCHPKFAAIPYGATLIPIKRPVWNHKVAGLLATQGKSIPVLTAPTNGRPRDPNSWAIWQKESEAMRSYIVENLRDGNMIEEKSCAAYLKALADGSKTGGGKIFHMVGLAKWRTLTSTKNSAVLSK